MLDPVVSSIASGNARGPRVDQFKAEENQTPVVCGV